MDTKAIQGLSLKKKVVFKSPPNQSAEPPPAEVTLERDDISHDDEGPVKKKLFVLENKNGEQQPKSVLKLVDLFSPAPSTNSRNAGGGGRGVQTVEVDNAELNTLAYNIQQEYEDDEQNNNNVVDGDDEAPPTGGGFLVYEASEGDDEASVSSSQCTTDTNSSYQYEDENKALSVEDMQGTYSTPEAAEPP